MEKKRHRKNLRGDDKQLQTFFRLNPETNYGIFWEYRKQIHYDYEWYSFIPLKAAI
jgi:hypothetical protein